MKRISTIFALLLASISLSAQALPGSSLAGPHSCESKSRVSVAMPKTMASNTYDVKYYRLEWAVDPAVNFISGKVTTYFVPFAPINTLEIDLNSSMTVDSVEYHNSNLVFGRPLDLISPVFPSTLPAGVLDSFSVYYQGTPIGSGFGSFIQATHGGSSTPIMWTLSEPYGARDWWPCKQDLIDKADSLDIFVTCPSAYRAAGNGVLVSETSQGPSKTFHWKNRHPIAAYLVAFAVTDYAVFSNWAMPHGDSLEVLNYVFPEELSAAQFYIPDVIPVLERYDSLFGPYPYMDEKYGHAQFGWGGGMEHQTMSFVINWDQDLLAHELAHQWFGDQVTCGSWRDIWLNEGFATYLTGLTYEWGMSVTDYQTYKQSRVNQITSLPDGSVWVDDTTSVGRIFDGRLSYAKGSYLLHMLRWICGDSAFFAGIRNYLADGQLSYNFSRTAHLQAHLEATSGLSLTGFFDDWYTGQGYPSYQVGWTSLSPTQVQVTLNQTQSHSSVSFFELPVPIRFSAGPLDTIVVFNHTANGQTFTADIGFVPSFAEFDPEYQIVSNYNTVVGVTDGAELDLQVFPNPSRNDFSILLPHSAPANYQVLDLAGKIIRSGSWGTETGAAHTFQGEGLPAGIYLLRVNQNGKTATQKLVLQD